MAGANGITPEMVPCLHCGQWMKHQWVQKHRLRFHVCIVCMSTHETVFCYEHNIWLCPAHVAGHLRAAHQNFVEKGNGYAV